jgi:hypothetical protein
MTEMMVKQTHGEIVKHGRSRSVVAAAVSRLFVVPVLLLIKLHMEPSA